MILRHALLPFLLPFLAHALDAASVQPAARRKLTGRFLHITDIHPDPFYKANYSVAASCHHAKPLDDPQRAGPLGTAVSECDTPPALVDHTFDFLEQHWAKEVDFVIWTGDNARHDIDSTLPRSIEEIYKLNRDLAARFRRMFENHGIPVVPSLGNNDIYPHNIIRAGPNPITNEFAKIWSDFIPGEDYHTVTRGVYFSREVIPGSLAVISLNTMYFFDNNKVVDGCPPIRSGEIADPGSLQLEWLLVQLDRWRQQGRQVWLSGHVPPTPSNWYPDCLTKFSEIVLSYQDTVLGQMYGHVDTFQYLDYRNVIKKKDTKKRRERYSVQKFVHDDIYARFADLPKKRKMKMEDFAIVNTGPSVIPTYLPSLRIWHYNVSNEQDRYEPMDDDQEEGWDVSSRAMLEALKLLYSQQRQKLLARFNRPDSQEKPAIPREWLRKSRPAPAREEDWLHHTYNASSSFGLRADATQADSLEITPHATRQAWQLFHSQQEQSLLDRADTLRKKRRKHRKKKPVPRLPRYFSPDSPSRKNRWLSPLGYTQYYLPLQSDETHPNWTIEYITYPHSQSQHFLPRQLAQSAHAAPSPYLMEDLTIPSWLDLARRLTDSKKLWKQYVRLIYVSTGVEDN